jgi:hypothetical protein
MDYLKAVSLKKELNIAFIYQMITVNYIWKHLVFAYPKRERYYISSLCFEMARQMTLSTELYVWRGNEEFQ